MRLHTRSLIFLGIAALFATVALTSCEDDPILAPHSGGKKSNGSYGNIAVAPPIDSSAAGTTTIRRPINPDVY